MRRPTSLLPLARAGRQIFTFAELRAQSQCWNCRGFGHVRTACPSSDGVRSITHVISTLQTAPDGSGKGKGKGKGKGEGAGGRGSGCWSRCWRWLWTLCCRPRGKGTIAVYLEDNHAYGLDGAFIATMAGRRLRARGGA